MRAAHDLRMRCHDQHGVTYGCVVNIVHHLLVNQILRLMVSGGCESTIWIRQGSGQSMNPRFMPSSSNTACIGMELRTGRASTSKNIYKQLFFLRSASFSIIVGVREQNSGLASHRHMARPFMTATVEILRWRHKKPQSESGSRIRGSNSRTRSSASSPAILQGT